MASLIERATTLFGAVKSSPSQPSHFIPIAADHVDSVEGIDQPLDANQHYFEVRINELFLSNKRQWFTTYDPMAIALVEYRYAGQPTAIPFVVGPSMLEKIGNKLPQGMVFANTRIAGPQPYRGDGLSISVILYRLKRDDMLRKLLKVIESTSKTLDFTGTTAMYTKVADAVLDGIDEVTGLDSASIPVLGRRQEFLPVDCGYYALFDGSAPAPAENRLWVRKKQLFEGESPTTATAYAAGDYVLFSISRVPRDDVSGLPFYATYLQAMEEANRATRQDIWESAKVKMSALYSLLEASPDLTRSHIDQLTAEWTERLVLLRKKAVGLSQLGPGQSSENPETAQQRVRALEILKL